MKIDLSPGAETAHERQTDLCVSLRYILPSLRDSSTVTAASAHRPPGNPGQVEQSVKSYPKKPTVVGVLLALIGGRLVNLCGHKD